MKKTVSTRALFAALCLATTAVSAQPYPTTIACPEKYEKVQVQLQALVSTSSEGCPLLDDGELRKLVDKFLPGMTFAYPAVPGTCLSGTITGGVVVTEGGPISVTGTTESAQRFFPEALAVNPTNGGVFLNGVSADGIQFASGAAATIVSLQGTDAPFDLQLVVSDRFTVQFDGYPFRDTEDFEIVGAKGASVLGRLVGQAEIDQPPGQPIANARFIAQGEICIK